MAWTGPNPTHIAGDTITAAEANNINDGVTYVSRNRYTANTTLALTDAGKAIDVDSAAAVTITVPAASTVPWVDGTVMEAVALNTGIVTLAPAPGVTFLPSGTWTLRTKGSAARIRKIPTGTAVLPSTGLLMRYRADDIAQANATPVASWPETSGNGLPAAVQATGANQPTLLTNVLNGHKVVSFNGTTNRMTLSGTALAVAQNKSNLGIFIAYNYPASSAGTRTLFCLSTGTSATSVRVDVFQRDPTTFIGAGGRRLDADASAVFISSGVVSTPGTAEIIAAAFDFLNSDVYIFRNGTQIGVNAAFQTAGSTSNTISLAGTIGSNLAGAAEWCQVQIAEIVVYSASDAGTRAGVDSYFQYQYGIVASDGGGGDLWHIQGDIA